MEKYKLLVKLDEDMIWRYENSDNYHGTEALRAYLLYIDFKDNPNRRLDGDDGYYLLEYQIEDYLYWAHWNATEKRMFKLCVYKQDGKEIAEEEVGPLVQLLKYYKGV